ncbi:hypothetical protein L1049_001798 [Liquidambar formosana]|uniref:BAH domain-containing protein n=1 Tax=Liquidambar formosana TaxID=63359 RepID=A0AAP0QYL7_LIQFO
MSHLGDVKEEDIPEFKWGKKKGVGMMNKDVQFYESFTYDGVEYFLYDCVYLWHENESEPYIGKIVKLWEAPNYIKKVKLVWFFRPIEILNYLGDEKPLENEIFLASGEGIGLCNLNPPEAISGKCNVICTSKDRRNPQASEVELRMADFIFYRTFNVGSCTLFDNFPDSIAGIKVECFFNRKKDQEIISPPKVKPILKERAERSSSFPKLVLDKTVENAVRDGKSVSTSEPRKSASKEEEASRYFRLPACNEKILDAKVPFSQNRGLSKGVNFHEKASKISDKASSQLAQDKGIKPDSQVFEVSRRPDTDTRKWFRQLPWEERMQRAHEQGTLVLLENLDPSYASSEVENVVWHAFNQRVEVKMIECSTFSSPHYGKAFVIFKSKVAAESAISELNRRCLMLSDGRPLIGRIQAPRVPGKPTNFAGHLVIDKNRLQRQREEMRDAVSTSHCSQPNTIEFEMAMEWRLLQEKSDRWWRALHEVSFSLSY